MKDESAGEVPVAFVVKSNESKITEEEVKQYISKQVYSHTSIVPLMLLQVLIQTDTYFNLQRSAGSFLQEN